MMDLIGLDTNLAITTAIYEALGRPERFAPPSLQRRLVGAGMTGRKAGKGFYLYTDNKISGQNPEASAGLPEGTALNEKEIWGNLAGAIILEAERLVNEGTAGKSDIDTAIKLAMNFPKGPFEWQKESTAI